MTTEPTPALQIDDPLTVPASLLPDVLEMVQANRDGDYYQFTLGAELDGSMYCSAFTHWVGWTDDTMRYEIREPSLVVGVAAFEQLYYIDQPALVVEGARQFAVWNVLGGHGIVERATAEELMQDRLVPAACSQAPTGSGFVVRSGCSSQELQYAPTAKLRMEVLTRDGFRCRACGRSPNDHVDLELHVHHIRPWGMGGLTHPLNLITLCNTCHRGLPARNGPDHYVRAFHDLVPRNTAGPEVERGAIQYRDAVLRYRECVVRRLAE